MSTSQRLGGVVLLLAIAPLAIAPAQAPKGARPLTEDQIARLVGHRLKLRGEVVVSMIQKQGLAFAADDAAIERLRQAGAPEVVLDAVRRAGAAGPAPGADGPVTYRDVVELLNLGVPEAEILGRLEQSPTTFTLDDAQVGELRRLGASEALLGAMGAVRIAVDPTGEITNLAIVLDCSGSMGERTPEGRTKMEAAREAAVSLVRGVPEGVRVAFVIYGHDRALECQAVQVVRPLTPLDPAGKAGLVQWIGRLQPVGSTPIALALRTAGRELARADAPSGLVLISDGKEMCGGSPAAEASALARGLRLGFGVQVVGFGVEPDGRRALEEIATAGGGTYHDAPTPAALRGIAEVLAERIEAEARPAPEAPRVAARSLPRGQPRFVTVRSPAIQLPPMREIHLVEGRSNEHTAISSGVVARCTQYDQRMRIPPVNRGEKFDLWWVPKADDGRKVKMVADLAMPLDRAELVVGPEEHLGLVRLIGTGLPATGQVFLGPPNYGQSVARHIGPHKVQTAAGYGQDLVVPPGTYNVWITPVGEDGPEVVAEKIEVEAGRVTVIE